MFSEKRVRREVSEDVFKAITRSTTYALSFYHWTTKIKSDRRCFIGKVSYQKIPWFAYDVCVWLKVWHGRVPSVQNVGNLLLKIFTENLALVYIFLSHPSKWDWSNFETCGPICRSTSVISISTCGRCCLNEIVPGKYDRSQTLPPYMDIYSRYKTMLSLSRQKLLHLLRHGSRTKSNTQRTRIVLPLVNYMDLISLDVISAIEINIAQIPGVNKSATFFLLLGKISILPISLERFLSLRLLTYEKTRHVLDIRLNRANILLTSSLEDGTHIGSTNRKRKSQESRTCGINLYVAWRYMLWTEE